MHPKVILNGKLTDATRARLPLASSAHLHGRGVFTTVAIYAGRPLLWPLAARMRKKRLRTVSKTCCEAQQAAGER